MGEAPSLVRRVAVAGAAAALLGGVVAALAAGLATGGMLEAHEDDLVLSAAYELAREVVEEAHEEGGDGWEEALDDELEDVSVPLARAAVDVSGVRVAGDRALVARRAGTCAIVDAVDGSHRICSVVHGDATITLATPAIDPQAKQRLLGWAGLIGVLVGALAGGGASALVARWAVAPLGRLRDRVRRVSPDAPHAEVLAEPLAYGEIEELRLALVDLIERLSASLAHAQRFAMDAAHELRTPLTTVLGELDLLAEAGEGPDRAGGLDRAALEPLRVEVMRLTALVQRLLALATPQASLATATEVVDLADVIEAIRASDADHRERLVVEAEDDVLVRGDAALLRIALQNGIDNALKFSQDAVTIRAFREGDEAIVDIVDDGPGIAPEERARVFEPFYRTPRARAGAAGHGIGLALVAHVARGMHGRAQLLDMPRGTCLRLRFPSLR